ncbi:MAG: hypothetical protein JST75_17590 [Bacteroidetes bacterium]|nr:hypothetical protein [Bacteroidota bacterium]
MKNRIKILLTLIGLFFYQFQLFAQTHNYSGTWVLNNEKSKILSRPDGMTSSVFIIKQVGNDFSLTIHHIFGSQQDTIVIKMLSDGKTRKVLSVLEGKLEQRKDGLHVTLWKKGFLDKVTYNFGKDENEFIADEVLVSDSDNHHNIWVFDREISK